MSDLIVLLILVFSTGLLVFLIKKIADLLQKDEG